MNKKMIVMLAVAAVSLGVFARPMHGGAFGHHRPLPPPMHHHHHHHSVWGHGGSGFWPGFVGGVIGGAVLSRPATPVVISQPAPVVVAPAPAPVIVQPAPVQSAPVIIQQAPAVQNVWVEGRYVEQVQANGSVVRVWQPGHYEQRVVQ